MNAHARLGAGWRASIALLFVVGCGERAGLPLPLEDASVREGGGRDASAGADGPIIASCTPGMICHPDNNLCLTGGTACMPEVPQCSGVTYEPRGTPCGTNQMCDQGNCVACAPGIFCNPGGNACQTGMTSCASGASACAPIGNERNGFPCGVDEVCFAGACTSCVDGLPCSPNGDACETGTTSCRTGQSTCVRTGDVADGTACGVGMCCGGVCAACGTAPNTTNTCSGKTCVFTCNDCSVSCGTSCADTTSDRNACGPSCAVCPNGSTCAHSVCLPMPSDADAGSSTRYGHGVQFSPCANEVQFAAQELYAQPVTVSAPVLLTALGVFGNQPTVGVQVIMALYSDRAGSPDTLLVSTASQAIVPGDNEIPVLPSTQIPAGIYWVAAEFNGVPSVCTDDSFCSAVDAVGAPLFGEFPAVFGGPDGGAPETFRTVDINVYLAGSE